LGQVEGPLAAILAATSNTVEVEGEGAVGSTNE